MNILFVLENYIPHIGGVEVLFKNLAETLVKKGHKVDIVTHRLRGTKKFEKINGVNVYRVNCMHSRYLFTFLAVPKVLKLAKKADVIHGTIFNGAFPAWAASKISGKKGILSVHEVWIGKWKKLTEMSGFNAWMHDLLERMVHSISFDKYITISDSTTKQMIDIGKPKSKISRVYCGVDYNHWNPSKYDGKKIRKSLGLDKNFVYVFTGRPGFSKGLEYVIKAVPEIIKKIPNAKLLALVSKDKDYQKRYNYIMGLIDKLGIKDKVVIHDPVAYKELPNYIKAADCVVVPSLAEGFGFTTAEACAMGKPVVASNTTSLPEVVSGKSVLVKPKSAEAIAQGVLMVHEGKAAKTPLKKFGLKEFCEGYIKVYKELIK